MKSAVGKLAILDFEASSLSQASWPVEIGLSWLAHGVVRTWSSLIRPAPDWAIDDWSLQSASVHGISLSDIMEAPSAIEVAETFFDILGSRKLVSDAPEFEARWLDCLLRAAGRAEVPSIADFDGVSFAMFEGYALDLLYETVERRPAPHRAGPDSARLARGWLKAAEHQVTFAMEGRTA
ncbi:3'-5' exonuclease [Mameliella alba]|nr:3'-5' exonuclease [Antarctobacter heliothermus]MBY6147047.1 3'-5' exonuclease [Mameliella alba]MCA0957052.1 3'-5' exonuclease [Mameliella alba]